MKAPQNQSNPKLTGILFKTIPAALIAVAMPLTAQVVIEGGPGTVQISDRDGQTEPTNTAPTLNTPVTAGVPKVVPRGPIQERGAITTVIANELEGTTVNAPKMMKQKVPATGGVIDAANTTTPVVVTASPEMLLRIAALEKEIGVQKTRTTAGVAVTTEGLYKDGTDMVNPLAEGQLMKIADYIRISEKKSVAITYQYVAKDTTKDTAWKRSLGLVEWMTSKGQLAKESFTLNDPEAVTVPTANPATPGTVADTEMVGRIVLSMQ